MSREREQCQVHFDSIVCDPRKVSGFSVVVNDRTRGRGIVFSFFGGAPKLVFAKELVPTIFSVNPNPDHVRGTSHAGSRLVWCKRLQRENLHRKHVTLRSDESFTSATTREISRAAPASQRTTIDNSSAPQRSSIYRLCNPTCTAEDTTSSSRRKALCNQGRSNLQTTISRQPITHSPIPPPLNMAPVALGQACQALAPLAVRQAPLQMRTTPVASAAASRPTSLTSPLSG